MPHKKPLNSQPRHSTNHYLSPDLLAKYLISRYTCTASTYSTCTLKHKYTNQHTHALVLHNYKYNSFQQEQYTLVQNSLSQTPDLSAQIPTNRTNERANLQEKLPNVPTQNSHITHNANKHKSMFIIKLNNKKAIYQTTNYSNQTLRTLLDMYTKTHHKLPSSCRISFANKTVCIDTPLSHYNNYSTPVFDIILPIVGEFWCTCLVKCVVFGCCNL